MKKTKQKRILVGLVAIAMLASYFFLPPVREVGAIDAIYDAQDLLTDSDLGVVATSTITFTTASSTEVGDYWRVVFPAQFSFASANFSCAYGDTDFDASSTDQTLDCTRSGGGILAAASTTQIVIGKHINPIAENEYKIYLYHFNSSDVLKEQVELMVAIVNDVLMTAHVGATLTFTVAGVNANATTTGSGEHCDATTTATTLDFGTLNAGASTTLCHQLDVSTNASNGYVVTVEQDGEMRNSAADNINSFIDSPTGTGSSTDAYVWQTPVGTLDNDDTYGHMGLHSDDEDLDTLSGGLDFWDGATIKYAGLTGTDPMLVLAHDGPTPLNNQNTGQAYVAYTAEITALQQAGDYKSILTYICTPTY